MTHTLTIPNWTPPRLNSIRGRHWSIEAAAKTAAVKFLKAYAWYQGVPVATGRRRVSLVLTGWPHGRLPDADAFDKVFLDSAVRSGLLLDDSAKGLQGRMAVTIKRSKVWSTTVTLEDV